MASAKRLASTGLPTTPEALHLIEAFRTGVRHSPRFAATAAAPADEDVDDEDRGGESQPLLSPPACVVAMTHVCDWAQAIQCTYSSLKPMPCQREGCNALVITYARVCGNARRAMRILLRAFVAHIILIINT